MTRSTAGYGPPCAVDASDGLGHLVAGLGDRSTDRRIVGVAPDADFVGLDIDLDESYAVDRADTRLDGAFAVLAGHAEHPIDADHDDAL